MQRITRKKRFEAVLNLLEKQYPQAETELQYNSPFELLVAVVLSAQCTDKRVNMTTPALFERFPDALEMSRADTDEIFAYIRSISYPNNKAKHLKGLAEKLVNEFRGEVPATIEELQSLPGVGRKTANVIVSVLHEAPAMAVDTHVFRVSARIGLTENAKTPLQTEMQLIEYIPEEKVHKAHHWLILHGRYICTARNPQCSKCVLTEWCKYYKENAAKA